MAAHTTLTVPQLQASAYIHPRGDLLDEKSRRDYLDIAIPLYRASIEGDLKVAKHILRGREHLVRCDITEKKETPLHAAATGRSTKLVSYLVNMMTIDDLELKNEDGNTAFCLAVISGNVGMAKIMVEKNRALLTICGSNNMIPLYLAALHGNHKMARFLYDQSDRTMGINWTYDHMNGVLVKCIEADIFDVAQRILEDNTNFPQDKQHAWDLLHALAQSSKAFNEISFWDAIIRNTLRLASILSFGTIPAKKESDAMLFLRLLWKRIIMQKSKDDIHKILRGPVLKFYGLDTYPSHVLFIAAKMNNRDFLVELIREYPDLLWMKNDDGQTIFHVAIAHRSLGVYSLLYEIGSTRDLITPTTDGEGNNILHLVGKISKKKAYDTWGFPALQLGSEYFWYERVKGILPPSYRGVRNAAGETPLELFTANRKTLVEEGMKSLNDSINISMVVAALVCTMAFSVFFQIPGMFADQNNGFPMFPHHKHYKSDATYFVLFVIFSFLLAASSVAIFLFVIPYRQHGNMKVLLRLWWAGQLALTESIGLIVYAFVVSSYFIYPNIPVIMYLVTFGVIPALLIIPAAAIYLLLNSTTASSVFGNYFAKKMYTLHG